MTMSLFVGTDGQILHSMFLTCMVEFQLNNFTSKLRTNILCSDTSSVAPSLVALHGPQLLSPIHQDIEERRQPATAIHTWIMIVVYALLFINPGTPTLKHSSLGLL